MRHVIPLLATTAFVVVGCSGTPVPAATPATDAKPATTTTGAGARPGATVLNDPMPSSSMGAQPPLATDPVEVAYALVDDEQALRDPSASEAVLVAAARRQQAAYRAIGRHPEWDAATRTRIPPALLEVYDRNVDARRQLSSMARAKDTLPPWRITAPIPADELLGDYREAESASGVGWNYLAAINLIETQFGSIDGLSGAGAQGPMQFLPSTFAAYGAGGDIASPRDSIMAAGRFLAANGFAEDRDRALYRYDNADQYVRAVDDYAAIFAADPGAFAGYHRWDVYYFTTAGDVVLPIGYAADTRIPVSDYLATHAR